MNLLGVGLYVGNLLILGWIFIGTRVYSLRPESSRNLGDCGVTGVLLREI